jgi:uncharacterized protein (DUF2384 family)
MLIELDLNMNDAESLLRHCTSFHPASGDCREDSRLADALEALAVAIKDSMHTKHFSDESMETIDPVLLEAAISLFQDRALAIDWLSKPKRGLEGRSPINVDTGEALSLIRRLEHRFHA